MRGNPGLYINNSLVTIRPAVHSDIRVLASLLKILFSIEKDFIFNKHLQGKGLELMISNERGCVLGTEVNGHVVGVCSGQGIGRWLMEEIAEWGRTKGVLRHQLLANRNNDPAMNFYKSLGWQTTDPICLRKFPVQKHA